MFTPTAAVSPLITSVKPATPLRVPGLFHLFMDMMRLNARAALQTYSVSRSASVSVV